MPIEGGPCSCCGATAASIWYGKKDGPKNCKKAECMRAGGYLMAKKVKKVSAATKRARATTAEVKEEDEEVINIDLDISEVIDIYGQRCAAPTPAPSPRARRPPCLPSGLHPALAYARAPLPALHARYCDPDTMEKHERRT